MEQDLRRNQGFEDADDAKERQSSWLGRVLGRLLPAEGHPWIEDDPSNKDLGSVVLAEEVGPWVRYTIVDENGETHCVAFPKEPIIKP